MKKLLVLVALLILMPQMCAAATDVNKVPVENQTNGDYILHSGDMISINVYGYPELSFPNGEQLEGFTIRPDGKITYPFLGEINAQGITAKELSRIMTDRLGKVYLNSNISVNIMRLGTERIYVLGEVNRPGSYELAKSRNLLDAISSASGWTSDAAKTKVFIIRKNQKGTLPIKVNLMALLENGDSGKNYALHQGDIVYLGGNHRIDLVADIYPLVNAAYMLQRMQSENNDSNQRANNIENPCP